jgi:hypothetical protein
MAINPLLNRTQTFSNISATPASFSLRGGLYGVTAKGTWNAGNATLQRLSPDNATYITVLTAIAADGFATVNLAPGTYRVLIATATAVYLDIVAIATDL